MESTNKETKIAQELEDKSFKTISFIDDKGASNYVNFDPNKVITEAKLQSVNKTINGSIQTWKYWYLKYAYEVVENDSKEEPAQEASKKKGKSTPEKIPKSITSIRPWKMEGPLCTSSGIFNTSKDSDYPKYTIKIELSYSNPEHYKFIEVLNQVYFTMYKKCFENKDIINEPMIKSLKSDEIDLSNYPSATYHDRLGPILKYPQSECKEYIENPPVVNLYLSIQSTTLFTTLKGGKLVKLEDIEPLQRCSLTFYPELDLGTVRFYKKGFLSNNLSGAFITHILPMNSVSRQGATINRFLQNGGMGNNEGFLNDYAKRTISKKASTDSSSDSTDDKNEKKKSSKRREDSDSEEEYDRKKSKKSSKRREDSDSEEEYDRKKSKKSSKRREDSDSEKDDKKKSRKNEENVKKYSTIPGLK